MSIWKNDKKLYNGKQYTGHYKWDFTQGYRVFVLQRIANKDKKHHIAFESWQMAKTMGWKKVK